MYCSKTTSGQWKDLYGRDNTKKGRKAEREREYLMCQGSIGLERKKGESSN